jgi:hypothetical protein
VVSAVLVVVAAAVVAVGVFAGVFLVMFGGRAGAGAYATVGVALVVAAAAGVGGMALAVSRVTRRRTAWPYALATLLVCVAAVTLGGAAYFG